MKIGFLSIFSYGSSIGGVENHIYYMSRELQKLGHDIIIFQPVEEERLIKKRSKLDCSKDHWN